MNNRQLLASLSRQLVEMGIEDGAEEARHALSYARRCSISALLLAGEQPASGELIAWAKEVAARRAAHEPLAYILGERWFMGLRFGVNTDVLIPRQETELLAEEALRLAAERGARDALDLCTGSGCVAVALAKLGGLRVTGADISPGALALARENAGENGADVSFVRSDLCAAIHGEYDLITANPPYVSEAEYAGLMPEVREHEPPLALLAGADGLDVYRRLIPQAAARLRPGGALLCEIGSGQREAVCALFAAAGLKNVTCKKDLAGRDRLVKGDKRG